MNTIDKELEKVYALLMQEKEEDLIQYKRKMANTSVNERRKEGVCWYPLVVDRTKFDAGERLLIKVSRPKEHNHSHLFQSGKLVSLFSNAGNNNEQKYAVNGVVNQVRDNDMIITLNADSEPDWLRDGNLGVQLLFDENSYLEMERALKIVLQPQDERLANLKHIILGSAEGELDDKGLVELNFLNASQNKALNLIYSAKDIAIVHGPPGTGKTTTMVESISFTLKTEKQVLVCAPSNAAVDLLVEKLAEKGLDVVRIGHPARVTEDVLKKTLDTRIAHHNNYKDLKAVKKQAEEYYQTAMKYKRNFGHEERQQRRLLLQESSKLKKEAEHLEYYIVNDILSNAQVIASTMVGASNYQIRDRKFSTVFIDEAAQGLEPATWIPITKANRVVLAGDHCQLPPTIKSFEAAKAGLDETLFEKAIKRNKMDVMLQEQYRMHKDIMTFSSRYFYNDKLIANKEVENWKLFNEDLSVEFIDTAGCGYFEQVDSETKSSFNREECELLQKHMNEYLSNLEFNQLTNVSVGVVSPYKAQVNLLMETLKGIEESYEQLKPVVAVNTIDSFQGQERDVIYISLVRSNEKGDIGFLKDIRRMNVAITRARKKLVIIGDSATVGQHDFYSKFLDFVNEIGSYRSAFEYMSY
ncbi:AAA domain-containing protein [Plebeiibacterium sediminum]|uniref:DNA helicase n=1 Tax=Plebeiibacterium sediminum TaxID=2992112 RepID=A0AAE3M4G8_9BACT|nr:AAA domain-containing protein [Plebeiobacterium sediminum]MCW3787057.1 AAA domain-containing protein [Plebeiobacterium sediminum]